MQTLSYLLHEDDTPYFLNRKHTDSSITPEQRIKDFFDLFSIDEAHEELWKMYKAAVQCEVIYDGQREISDLTFFFERLTDLINAAASISKKEN